MVVKGLGFRTCDRASVDHAGGIRRRVFAMVGLKRTMRKILIFLILVLFGSGGAAAAVFDLFGDAPAGASQGLGNFTLPPAGESGRGSGPVGAGGGGGFPPLQPQGANSGGGAGFVPLHHGAPAFMIAAASPLAPSAAGPGGSGNAVFPPAVSHTSGGNGLTLQPSNGVSGTSAAADQTQQPPVPEPQSWLFMIGGFAGLGVCLRRRRAVIARRASPSVPRGSSAFFKHA